MGLDTNLFYFRDSNNNEVDLIFKQGNKLNPIEIKSSITWNNGFAKSILKFNELSGNQTKGCVVYGGDLHFNSKDNISVNGFERFSELFKNFGTL